MLFYNTNLPPFLLHITWNIIRNIKPAKSWMLTYVWRHWPAGLDCQYHPLSEQRSPHFHHQIIWKYFHQARARGYSILTPALTDKLVWINHLVKFNLKIPRIHISTVVWAANALEKYEVIIGNITPISWRYFLSSAVCLKIII